MGCLGPRGAVQERMGGGGGGRQTGCGSGVTPAWQRCTADEAALEACWMFFVRQHWQGICTHVQLHAHRDWGIQESAHTSNTLVVHNGSSLVRGHQSSGRGLGLLGCDSPTAGVSQRLPACLSVIIGLHITSSSPAWRLASRPADQRPVCGTESTVVLRACIAACLPVVDASCLALTLGVVQQRPVCVVCAAPCMHLKTQLDLTQYH